LKQGISINCGQLWEKVLTPGAETGVSWHELIPNETAVTYNALARYFEGSKPTAKYRLTNGTICYVYRRKDGSLIAAVWNYRKRTNTLADLSGFKLLDLFGNPVPSGLINVRHDPYYILQRKHGEQEFLKALGHLKIELSDPFRSSPLVRIIGGNAVGTLKNDSAHELSSTLLFSGNGFASSVQTVKVPAYTKLPFSLPLHKKSVKTPGELNLEFAGRKQVIPVETIPAPRWNSGETKEFSSPDKKLRCTGTAVLKDGRCTLNLEVRDASDSGPLGDRMHWETDCVELFADLNPAKIPLEDPQFYTPETFRIFVMPRNGEGEDHVRVQGKAVSIADLSCRTKLLKDGYRIRLSFPAGKQPCIGFDIKVDDSGYSKSSARREAAWGGGNSLYRNRCNFGILSSLNQGKTK